MQVVDVSLAHAGCQQGHHGEGDHGLRQLHSTFFYEGMAAMVK
jgi:hypothetical protein